MTTFNRNVTTVTWQKEIRRKTDDMKRSLPEFQGWI